MRKDGRDHKRGNGGQDARAGVEDHGQEISSGATRPMFRERGADTVLVKQVLAQGDTEFSFGAIRPDFEEVVSVPVAGDLTIDGPSAAQRLARM